MKIYVTPPMADRGMNRIAGALEKYAPKNVTVVEKECEADLVVLHAMGRIERLMNQIIGLLDSGKEYAVIQYAIRSTQKPSAHDWMPIWKNARLVWSYYNLIALCEEDGIGSDFRFYHSPLGTDFSHEESPRRYVIATSGLSYLAESVKECRLAADAVGGKIFHVGPNIRKGFECSDGIGDLVLAKKYSECQYVSGLRRMEGFEFPVIEGFFCGARPICFDRPHYRQWFNEFAIFIPELPRAGVEEELTKIFREKPRNHVSRKEQDTVRERFSWSNIIHGFYESLL